MGSKVVFSRDHLDTSSRTNQAMMVSVTMMHDTSTNTDG